MCNVLLMDIGLVEWYIFMQLNDKRPRMGIVLRGNSN